MVRLREIPRTAAFAWSPGPGKPMLVTGTRAGAVDADFSGETTLELWDLNLDGQEQGLELQPLITLAAESRFFDMAWGLPIDGHDRGIIAGATESGSLDLWDAKKLLEGKQDALISRTTKHGGPIKSLQFNPLRPQVLATAGAKGEVFIWDINDMAIPFRLGTAAARADDIECVAWNRKVANILATGGTGGFVTVWDLKTKKASLTLNNNRKAVSAIAWDPNNSTKLLTATPDDGTPVIYLWDLRNSNAPERTLQGHDKGVLSLSWCQQDAELLISCGKDNRTLVWNPLTGERYGEFPEVTNWTISTRFNPVQPSLSATASFDGKILIQTLQNTNPNAVQASQSGANDDDGDAFFTKAQTQPQGASFTLSKAPAWYRRSVGASFGYGGKLVTFACREAGSGNSIRISHFAVDSDISSATDKFEKAMQKGDIAAICQSHVEQAKTEEAKAEWRVMQVLSEADGRQRLVEHLGFSREETKEEEAKEEATNGEEKEGESKKDDQQTNGRPKHRRVASMWGDGDDGDDFLSTLAANKGTKIDDPFHLLGEGNTSLEDTVTRALMLGHFEKAADLCLKEGRMADAFIVANCGGRDLVDKVQSAYLAQKNGSPSYLRLLSSVVAKNLWDVVYNADLADWKETMVTLCTFADPSEFPDLCEALGDRIYESGSRKDASFCFLVGSKLEKVVGIWLAELEEEEKAGLQEPGGDSTFSVHARCLQQFIEKVTVFRHVTKLADQEDKTALSGWKLASLYDKYAEYADMVAAQGLLSVAQKYLDLLPVDYPAADVGRNRVKLATQRAAPQTKKTTVVGQPAPAVRAAPLMQPVGYQQPGPAAVSTQPTAPAPNPYAPAAAPNPYAPANSTAPYQQSGTPYSAYASSAPTPAYGAPQGAYGQTAAPFGAPPRHAKSPAAPPPKAKDVGAWNDVPMVTKPPVRRNTPSVAPITSPFPGGQPSPPMPGPYQRSAPTPPPPPPKGSAPPRNTSSPMMGAGPRPPSTVSTYAPPPPQGAMVAPPTAPSPSNRYAPAPSPQQYNQALSPTTMAPRPPPPNPYAAAPPASAGPGQYAPSPYETAQATRPPVGPPPPSGPRQAGRAPPPGPPAAPPKARHPPGDRSNIPENARALVDILSTDMARVAAKAPSTYTAQVKDTQKRLGLLFDDLNNQDRVQPDTIGRLDELSRALAARDYDTAARMQVDIQRERTEECGQWMVGVKRLIVMSKATA